MIRFGVCLLLTTFASVSLKLADGESNAYSVCQNTQIDGYAEKWGYVTSDNWPGSYGYSKSCTFQINVPDTRNQYISIHVVDWVFDRSGYGDRLTIWNYWNGQWNWVNDFYYNSDLSVINNYIALGNIRFNWYSDAVWAGGWTGTPRWRVTFTFQNYLFGCELSPQPYIFPNTTKNGVIQSPFFPDHYPVNSYCETIIDVDQATDSIEFVPILFNFRAGDSLSFYVGDSYLQNWVQYALFNSTIKPDTFRIYASDVKTLFTSDYVGSSYGYQFYWRVISKERYPIYKPESLIGFWPMTAAHRGRDVVGGCDAVTYPTSGTITPAVGPFGHSGSALYFESAYLNMTSATCIASTQITTSFTISAFSQTSTSTAVVEFVRSDSTTAPGIAIWSNSPTASGVTFATYTLAPDFNITTNLPNWQQFALSYHKPSGKLSAFTDATGVYQASGNANTLPPSTSGFLFGYRDSRIGNGGTAQTGRFTCLAMYAEAMRSADIGQIRSMCQKFHDQYEIYQASTLVGWWPMDGVETGSTMIRDVSGNGYHGQRQSVNEIGSTAAGPASGTSALTFSKTANGFINIPYSMTILKSFTMSVYLMTTDSDQKGVIDFISSSSGRGMVLDFYLGSVRFYPSFDASPSVLVSASGITLSSWVFISVTYESWSGDLKLYANAVQVAAVNIGANFALGTSTYGIAFGRNYKSTERYFGNAACFSIYSSALTSVQLAKAMKACKTGHKTPPAQLELLGFWPLTNLTGLQDISGNELHGTAQSAGVTLVTGPFGIPNTAYAIGASLNSYIKFPGGAGTNLGTGSWTISCYVKTLVSGGGPLLEYLSSSTNGIGIHLWPGSTTLYFNDYVNNPTVQGFNWNQWQFVSWSYDAVAGTTSLWRDGAILNSWSGRSSSVASTFGFNLGYRANGGNLLNAQVACLSIYRVALDADGIGKVMAMCQSYLMDQALRDQTRTSIGEINCNFDNGFCGWTHGLDSDITNNWMLNHDATPSGQANVWRTGPRFGKSAERVDAFDQYAYINSAIAGFNSYKARLLSPVMAPGWHCFEFWYYMSGGNVAKLEISLVVKGDYIFKMSGSQSKQWNFEAVDFYIDSADYLGIDGFTGSSMYSDIAIDSIRVTDGRCMATTPCPSGWLDFGRKCYMSFTNRQSSYADASDMCVGMQKARLARPENVNEFNYIKSLIGGSTIYLEGTLSGSTWINRYTYPIAYLLWAGGQPTGGATYLGMNSNGFVAITSGSYSYFCETTKLEAQHLGFNCTFDNKHICGWRNDATADSTELAATGGASIDVDVWGGIALPWGNEDDENGPEWDWNQGSKRGYYLLLSDGVVTSCSSLYSDFYSPIMKSTGKPQCLRLRTLRTTYANKVEVTLLTLASNTNTWTSAVVESVSNENVADRWRTFQFEFNPAYDYKILIRFWLSCNANGYGNQAIDSIELFDNTCAFPLFGPTYSLSATNSKRPIPGVEDAQDTLGDFNFVTCDDKYPWRQMYIGNTGKFTCTSFQSVSSRRSGPASDYTGESNYLNADFTNGGSLTGIARYSGPAVPSGQRCLIFHYFEFGYDVGELRLGDANGRYLWARQGNQNPAWKEHRILFNGLTPTNLIFEGSSGLYDGVTHFQKYQSLQLDDIYLRNGSDLCLGFMDCDFDESSYLLDCGWQQNDTDDADWIRNSGETPAGNANSGPNADQTTGTGHYLYFDASDLRPNAAARIHMPPIGAGDHCLTFYYYMWGKDMGSLRLFYVPQSNLATSNGNFSAYSEKTLWFRQGEQGNYWIRAMVPLQLVYPQILTFEARRGNGDRSDIAIDDVVLLRGACPNDRSLSCSFERGDTCTWYNDATDQRNFVINRGKTTGSPMTGPEGDATGEYAGGFYAYLPAAGSSAGDTARLISPQIAGGSTVCFQVKYNMRGRQLGTINIYRNSDRLVRIRGGSTGYEWRRIVLTIHSDVPFVIKIEAVRGQSTYGDIAVDDITVTDGTCANNNNNNNNGGDPVTFYSKSAGYSLNGHVILSKASPSLAGCLADCRGVPGSCFSINYNSATSECQFNNVTISSDPGNFQQTMTPDWTYVSAVSGFREMDTHLGNLCTLDSTQCTVTQNCVQIPNSAMLACSCAETGLLSCYMPPDCSIAFQNGYLASGAYLIQPGVTANPFMAWCEMDTASQKGYTVLIKRFNGGTRFHNRKLAEYRSFFGSANREYWAGLDAMSQLTNQANYGYVIEGSVDGTAYSPISGMSVSEPFVVAGAVDQYRMKLQQVGTMTSLMYNMTFSTADADQTDPSLQCGSLFSNAGWWYSNCQAGLLTGIYRPRETVGSSNSNGLCVADFGSGIGLTSVSLKITRL